MLSACSATIVPIPPLCTASIAPMPKRVANTRSNAVGEPPRCIWPRIGHARSIPVYPLDLSGQQIAYTTQPHMTELVDLTRCLR